MAVYDSEDEDKKFDPNEESTSDVDKVRDAESEGDSEAGDGAAKDSPEKKEKESLEDKMSAFGEKLKEEDSAEGGPGLFKDSGKLKSNKGGVRNLIKNRKFIAAAGGGLIGIAGMGVMLLGFLNVFQLDHILNNIDQSTFARFNATFDRRSDKWFRAYLQMRMMELDGTASPDGDGNLYFRSNKVDTDHPARDWYRTMRTGRFERDLFENNGIRFESAVDSEGRIKPARIILNDNPVATIDVDGVDTSVDLRTNPAAFDEVVNKVNLDMDVEFFDSDRQARKAIKEAVNDNTRWYRVIKRRHLRKDIANMTGVRSWRFFEKTRDKIDNRKIAVQRKILQRVFSDNSNTQKFLLCLLAGDGCPRNADTSNPDSRADLDADGNPINTGDDDEQVVGSDDDAEDRPDGDADDFDLDRDELTSEITDGADEALAEIADEGVEEAVEEATESASQKVIRSISSKFAGGGPQKIWTVMKTISGIHQLFATSGDQDSKIVTLVKSARLSQAVAVYSTYAIARDQIKSGELVPDETAAFFDTTKNFASSEGWQYIQQSNANSVSAQASQGENTNVDKATYCEGDFKKTKEMFAWYCDSQKPNSGGNVENLQDAYNTTFAFIGAPINAAVEGVSSIPGVDWLLTKTDEAMGALTDKALALTGLDGAVENVAAWAMTRLIDFAGVGPQFDGSQPGVANFMVTGSAGLAEGGTRSAGGRAQDEESKAYTNKLAQDYRKQQYQNMSLAEKYVSIDNPDSVASKSLFAVASSSPAKTVGQLFDFGGRFANISNLLTGFSSVSAQDASSVAEFAGVDRNDIPQTCVDRDPLGDLAGGTNFTEVTGRDLDWETARNSDAFYEELYDWVGDDGGRANQALTVYNCHLLDARVQGGLGFTSGYTGDFGYEGTSPENQDTTQTTTSEITGDAFSSSENIDCAEGTTNLGVHTGFNNGVEVQHRLCAIPNISSTAAESSASSQYYIDGANGKVIVNSRVSGVVLAMANAASGDGVTLTATSAFRSNSHQTYLWNENGRDPDRAARPGYSNHQNGTAIDFSTGGPYIQGAGCSNKSSSPNNNQWNWLVENASQFGYGQYAAEAWHWDPAEGRC